MQFSDIVASGNHADYLKKAVDQENLPHAMLLWGSRGTGKLATALTLSQYILCDDRSDGTSCGVCKSCVKTRKFIHPDVTFVFPVTNKNDKCANRYPEWRKTLEQSMYIDLLDWLKLVTTDSRTKNPNGKIYAKEIERINEALNLRSFESGKKVLIIWMAEYLGNQGNKLLKMIEEPPPETFILLIAEDRTRILPTIISRCQQLHFPPLTESQITSALIRKHDVEESRAKSIAAAAEGSWFVARELVDSVQSHPIQQVQDWIRACWSNDMGKLVVWVNDIHGLTRQEQRQFAGYLLALWQKLFWHKWGLEYFAEQDELQLIKWLNTKIEINEFDELRNLTEHLISSIERNAYGKVLWMDASLKFREALIKKHAKLRSAS